MNITLAAKKAYLQITSFFSKLWDKPLGLPTDKDVLSQKRITKQLDMLTTTQLTKSLKVSPHWLNGMMLLAEHIRQDDIRDFLRWDIIRNTMVINQEGSIIPELFYLRRQPDWNNRWKPAIAENNVGHPIPYWIYPKSSGTLIHHSYHIAQFERNIKRRIDSYKVIIEFGGGYGSMCRLIHKLGFKGKYIIFDLPHFSLVQFYYLSMLGIANQTALSSLGSDTREGIFCCSNFDNLNAFLSCISANAGNLLIGTWSLSEAPIDLRDSILSLHSIDAYIIAFQDKFGDFNNLSYFSKLQAELKGINWHQWQIPHLKHNYYLMGIRK